MLVLNGEHSPLLLNILSTNATLSCLALDLASYIFEDGQSNIAPLICLQFLAFALK